MRDRFCCCNQLPPLVRLAWTTVETTPLVTTCTYDLPIWTNKAMSKRPGIRTKVERFVSNRFRQISLLRNGSKPYPLNFSGERVNIASQYNLINLQCWHKGLLLFSIECPTWCHNQSKEQWVLRVNWLKLQNEPIQRSKLVVETIGTGQAQGAVPMALQQDFQPPATKHPSQFPPCSTHRGIPSPTGSPICNSQTSLR